MNTFLVYGLLVLLVSQVILVVYFVRLSRFLRSFTEGISTHDLSALLSGIGASLKKLNSDIDLVRTDVAVLDKQALDHFQHMGFVRYNPFSDTGGDQSFCLCILDNHQNGVVITSLHSREHTRIYAKPILQGKSDGVVLSKEEEAALRKALQ